MLEPVILHASNEEELREELSHRHVEIGLCLGRMALQGIERCEKQVTFALIGDLELRTSYEHYTDAMQRGLEAAISAEEYELAAELRDMLATV